jgi:hypothetical protein
MSSAAAITEAAETLMNVVALIARRFQTDVCSVYLLEPNRSHLVLAATSGLGRECIGTLRLALHEGLAGLIEEHGSSSLRSRARRSISRSSGFHSLTVACCRASWWCRPSGPGSSMRRTSGCWWRRRLRWLRWLPAGEAVRAGPQSLVELGSRRICRQLSGGIDSVKPACAIHRCMDF